MKKSPEHILIEWLVIQSQRGDKRAINLLARRWHPKLIRQAYRLTRDKEAANDIVQESWQGIIKGLNKLKDPAVFPGWAYQIVTRRAADWIRKLQRERKISETSKNESVENDTELHNEDNLITLRKALHHLPNEQRVILDLFYLEEQSIKDIGEILLLPVGTVKSRLFYAREHLKKIYKKIET